MKESKSRFELVLGQKDAERFEGHIAELIEGIDLKNDTHGEFEQKVFSHLDVFQSGAYSVEPYIKACEFVMHFSYNRSKRTSYALTFPERVERMEEEGRLKDVGKIAGSYFTGQLVQNIMAQSTISLGLIHASKATDSINTLHRLSQESTNERIQMESADKLLGHLTVDEKNTFNVKHSIQGHGKDFIGEMQAEMIKMREAQKDSIRNGGDLKTITNVNIIEAEVFDEDN